MLRFKDGDWVEIIDDVHELDQVPGELRKVEVHEEDGTLRFTPPCPPICNQRSTQAAERHLRVRRWDQQGQVKSATGTNLDDLDQPASTGAIHVPASSATAVVLENGVTVSFSSTGGRLPTGRPLDLRRADGRHVGRGARRRAATRHPPPLRAPCAS